MWDVHGGQHELEPCAGEFRHRKRHLQVQMATTLHVKCTQAQKRKVVGGCRPLYLDSMAQEHLTCRAVMVLTIALASLSLPSAGA